MKGVSHMKQKLVIIATVTAVVLAVLAVLVVPFRTDVCDDGGTKDYRALTYRLVKWKHITDDGYYEKTRVYFFGDISKSIDELWEREEPNVVHRFIATVVELSGGTALVEPAEFEWERGSSDRISFGISELPDIGAEIGSVVQVTYRGAIRESYPATIDAIGWEIANDLRHIEFTDQWLDAETAEQREGHARELTISEIYSNCFFAWSREGMPYEFKINGTLSDEWCVGDFVRVSFQNLYKDANNRYEGEMSSIALSDWEWDSLVCAKPVIYLYPEEETEVSVRLTLDGKLTCTYPAYENGWTVTAQPDGTLTDAKGQTYNYLYWEGETCTQWDMTTGFCVRGEDTAAFLEEALAKLGLNRREANEFIVYWLPLMEGNPYNIISFQTDRYADAAKLDIEPAPDTLIRVFMAWQASESYVQLEAQELTAPERTGFTVIEWGGTRCGG